MFCPAEGNVEAILVIVFTRVSVPLPVISFFFFFFAPCLLLISLTVTFPVYFCEAMSFLTMFFSTLRQEGQRGMTWRIPFPKLSQQSFPWRVNLCYGEKLRCFTWLLFPSPCQSLEGIFLESHYENLVGFLEGKPPKVWGSPKAVAPNFSVSYQSILSLWQFIKTAI